MANLTAIIWILLAFICAHKLLTTKSRRLPPGPSTFSVLRAVWNGNASSLTKLIQEYHDKYGPIISFRVGNRIIISLGSRECVIDLFKTRGNVYGSRPKIAFILDHMTKGKIPGLAPYNATRKHQSRMSRQLLNLKACTAYQYLQCIESKQLLLNLISNDNFHDEFRRYACSTSFALCYGKRIPKYDQEEIKVLAQLGLSILSSLSMADSLADMLPILDYLPEYIAQWKRKGNKAHNMIVDTCSSFLTEAAQRKWNWGRELLQSESQIKEPTTQLYLSDWDKVCWKLFELLVAITETSNAKLKIFTIACILHPEEVRKAQVELDSVVGQDRLPCFDDLPNLPYTQAFVKEVHRWRSLSPLGVPRSVIKEDEYMGYVIRPNDIIITNTAALYTDERLRKDATSFRPDRWIGTTSENLIDATFGLGRRKCPGQTFAQNSFNIATARLLWAFDFTHWYEDGKKIELDLLAKADKSIVWLPPRFKASIKVRSAARRAVIEQEWMATESDSDKVLEEVWRRLYASGAFY